jgi:hypothetical protein
MSRAVLAGTGLISPFSGLDKHVASLPQLPTINECRGELTSSIQLAAF